MPKIGALSKQRKKVKRAEAQQQRERVKTDIRKKGDEPIQGAKPKPLPKGKVKGGIPTAPSGVYASEEQLTEVKRQAQITQAKKEETARTPQQIQETERVQTAGGGTNLAQGIIGGISTNIGLGSLTGGAVGQAQRLTSKDTALGEVARISKGGVAGATAGVLGSGASARVITGFIIAAIGFDAAQVWLASDNIITAININTGALVRNIRDGEISPEEARAAIEQAEVDISEAEAFIKSRTTLNPLTWPAAKIILLNANIGRRNVENAKELIESL